MSRKSRDPYWLTARFAGQCAKPGCSHPIKKGDRIYYFPSSRTVFCEEHGKEEHARFAAAAADEAFMSGQTW